MLGMAVLGVNVGAGVGVSTGEWVGDAVGCAVGTGIGAGVGVLVGEGVGVGVSVGDGVGLHAETACSSLPFASAKAAPYIPVNTYWPSTVPRCGRRPGADVGRSPRGCARQCWHRPSADLGQYRRRFRPALMQRRAHSGAVLARSKCSCGQSGAGCDGTHDCVRMSAV